MKLYRVTLHKPRRTDFVVPYVVSAEDRNDVLLVLKEKYCLIDDLEVKTIEEIDMSKEQIVFA